MIKSDPSSFSPRRRVLVSLLLIVLGLLILDVDNFVYNFWFLPDVMKPGDRWRLVQIDFVVGYLGTEVGLLLTLLWVFHLLIGFVLLSSSRAGSHLPSERIRESKRNHCPLPKSQSE